MNTTFFAMCSPVGTCSTSVTVPPLPAPSSRIVRKFGSVKSSSLDEDEARSTPPIFCTSSSWWAAGGNVAAPSLCGRRSP